MLNIDRRPSNQRVDRKALSLAIVQLMPMIIQGAHLGFLAKRTITQTQFFVLVAIYSNGRCSMRKLATNIHVSMPTISGIVDRLAKAGYVSRNDDPRDRRHVMVELTEKGKGIITQFQLMISRRWQEVLASLDPKEIEAFYNIVKKLSENLKGDRV